jgi:hypothetical protein
VTPTYRPSSGPGIGFLVPNLRKYECRTCRCPVAGHHPASRKDCDVCLPLPLREKRRRMRERLAHAEPA